jgi:hypothetical protein
MLRQFTTIFLTFTFAIPAFVQNYEPQILILTPNEFTYAKSFEKIVNSKNQEFAQNVDYEEKSKYVNSSEFKN